MTVSNCHEHGDLMRDLARGRLDDERSLRAETVREECAECARWWNETFSGEAYDAVDGSVTEAISSFVPPARRRYRWLAAAAALVLVVGIGATSMLWRDAQTSPAHASDVVSTWDFEEAGLESIAVEGADDLTHTDEVVFENDLESGDLSSWSFHS